MCPRPCLISPLHHPTHLLLPSQYADPVTDLLDQCGVFRTRLFRESCVFHQGCYVKDLSRLGRDLHKTLILDNSPASYIFHPHNAVSATSSSPLLPSLPGFNLTINRNDSYSQLTANLRPLQVPVLSWFDDMEDGELLNLLPVFEELSGAEDVYARLDQLRGL